MRKSKTPTVHPDNLIPHEDRPYRAGVGIMLFNRDGLVFVGERIDNEGAWQMPQGGIDDGEEAEVSVFRELEEEIGTRNARIIQSLDEWLYYDIPAHTANKLWGGKYRGQKQKWIALEFLGDDGEIDLRSNDHPEFGRWKWVALCDLIDHIVPFKRDMYRRLVDEFAHIPDELAQK